MTTRYRVSFNPMITNGGNLFRCEPTTNLGQAIDQLDLIANYTLHLHKLHLMPDYSNTGWIEVSELGGEWEIIDEEDLQE